MFFITLTMGFGSVQAVALIFPIERPVFLREVNNNMYSVSAYFWAKIASEFPMTILIPTLQLSVAYFAIGMNTDQWYKFPVCIMTCCLMYNAFGGIGYILGTAISNKQAVAVLTPVLIVPQMLFAGFFINQDNIPKFLWPIQHISIFKYGFQALMLNEFTDLDIACMKSTDPKELCNPLDDFKSPQTLNESLLTIVGLWLAFYLISFALMKSLSKTYD